MAAPPPSAWFSGWSPSFKPGTTCFHSLAPSLKSAHRGAPRSLRPRASHTDAHKKGPEGRDRKDSFPPRRLSSGTPTLARRSTRRGCLAEQDDTWESGIPWGSQPWDTLLCAQPPTHGLEPRHTSPCAVPHQPPSPRTSEQPETFKDIAT